MLNLTTDLAVGPIVPVFPWATEEELLGRVNDTRTGLEGADVAVLTSL